MQNNIANNMQKNKKNLQTTWKQYEKSIAKNMKTTSQKIQQTTCEQLRKHADKIANNT